MYFFPIHLPGPQNERWLLPPPTGNTSRTSEKPLAPLLAFSLDCVYRPGAAKLFVYLPDGMAFSSPPYSCISAWPEGSPYFFHSRILAPFIAWGGQLLKPLANQPCPLTSWGGLITSIGVFGGNGNVFHLYFGQKYGGASLRSGLQPRLQFGISVMSLSVAQDDAFLLVLKRCGVQTA